MRVSSFALVAGVLLQAQQVEAWWGEDLWNWLTGDALGASPDPIAIRMMNDPNNFSDRCRPREECWPTDDEWTRLKRALS